MGLFVCFKFKWQMQVAFDFMKDSWIYRWKMLPSVIDGHILNTPPYTILELALVATTELVATIDIMWCYS